MIDARSRAANSLASSAGRFSVHSSLSTLGALRRTHVTRDRDGGDVGSGDGEVTHLLARWADGDRAALDALTPIVYGELRKIADAFLRRERSSHTLQPTALVHEAWLRLMKQDQPSFDHRKQFYALAAQMMRRILVDHARAVNAEKRGGGSHKTALDPDHTVDIGAGRIVEFLVLDQALTQLSRVSARQAQVIELRYFAGLNLDEISGLLGVSPATISRDQRSAEAWLSHVMADRPA
jgi:RNA polymerase sigma-70 factor, ECF subfamily